MACSVCSANVEKKLQSLEGINSASVSLASRTALVDYDPDIISLEDMKREISNAGYDLVIENDRSVEEINRREFTLLRRRTIASWLFAILTMCFSMGWISLGMEQNMISDGVASAHHSSSFANQTIAQIELFNKTDEYFTEEGAPKVETLPKHLDEKVAQLHLDALGVELTELTKEQAEYLGVDVAGPYKPDHYRY